MFWTLCSHRNLQVIEIKASTIIKILPTTCWEINLKLKPKLNFPVIKKL